MTNVPSESERRFVPTLTNSELFGPVDKPVQGGYKAPRRVLHRRMVVDGERTYTAYSADELMEIDSIATHGRPGQPY